MADEHSTSGTNSALMRQSKCRVAPDMSNWDLKADKRQLKCRVAPDMSNSDLKADMRQSKCRVAPDMSNCDIIKSKLLILL